MGEYGENIGKMLQKLDPVSSICSRGTGGGKEKGISFFLHVPGGMFFYLLEESVHAKNCNFYRWR